MADLKNIYILHTTSTKDDANTDADFELIAALPGRDYREAFTEWPANGHNEREKGRTDEYRFNVSGRGVKTNSELNIRMTSTNDGWLPESMWVIGETTSGKFEVLGHHPKWNKGWFDRGSGSVGQESHKINNN